MKWRIAWQLIKDVALTGTGIALIVLQAIAEHPSSVVLVTGLALTVPSAASHAASLLSGPSVPQPGPPSSSPPSPPPGPSPSPSPSQEQES